MSDQIKHECGIALIRLLQPLSYYQKKYGTSLYGLDKLRLLMQKQRNRGQDGAGLATIKLDPLPGNRYISRKRTNGPNYLDGLFEQVYTYFEDLFPQELNNPKWLKENLPYTGELLLGHLRYGTHGDNTIETCHPFLRQNNWISRNLVLAGNFNLTNVDELFDELVSFGQYPKLKSDTVTVLEKIGHFLDDEVKRLHDWYKPDAKNIDDLNQSIFKNLDVTRLLKRASKDFDGGYAIAGLIGHGDAFVMRDPRGIRPAYYYQDEEVVVVASERPAIQTAFNVHHSQINEIGNGHVLVIKKDGRVSESPFIKKKRKLACSFERIYFSRGTDRDIYIERKRLGEQLTGAVLKSVKFDFKNTVFSYVPNTAETAFYGLMEGVQKKMEKNKFKKLININGDITEKKLEKIISVTPRIEKIIVKDAKLRTFITAGKSRDGLVSHAYDVTYGIVKNEKDTIVLLDDSIVRGTTLKNSIIKIVSRLRPKKILIVSSAPQIRYPDCYGIDMSVLKDFVAFRALIALLDEQKKNHLLQETYERCKASLKLAPKKIKNEVIPLYDTFSTQEISDKIAKLVTPKGTKPKIEVIYQTLEGLKSACPNHTGDWYFSGKYPTPGGNRIVNKAFINFMEDVDERAY